MRLHFENPTILWALLLLLPLGWLMLSRAKRVSQNAWRKLIFVCAGFALALFGLARPQLGRATSQAQARKGQVFIAFDISRSMLVEDMGTSRLDFAVAFAKKLLAVLPNIRIALYPFAADGYLQMPLTTDMESVSDMVGSLTPTMTTHQGTDLTLVLTNLFAEIKRQEKKATETGGEWVATQVVLISDGETHIPLRSDILAQYRSANMPIFTVGAGTVLGGTVPIAGRYVNTPDKLTDDHDRPVISKFHPETLKEVAERTGGAYFPPAFDETYRLSDRLSQSIAFGRLSTTFKVERELYPWLFAIALVLFLIEFGFGRWEYAIRSLAIFLLLSGTAFAEDETKAIETYNAAVKKMAQDPSGAAELFQESAMLSTDPNVRKRALYNLGNALLKKGEPKQAIQAYQNAYDTVLDDENLNKDANRRISENLVLAAKILKQMKSQPQSGDGEGQQGQASDPKGPKKDYESQSFSEQEKQRIYDAISSEEQQVLQRIQQDKGKKSTRYQGKPW